MQVGHAFHEQVFFDGRVAAHGNVPVQLTFPCYMQVACNIAVAFYRDVFRKGSVVVHL